MKLIIWFYGRLLNLTAYITPSFAARKGFELFCTPFNIKLKPKQAAFLDTAENEHLEAEGIPTIHVYKWGNGSKKILFMHGWQSHSFRWIKYILALKEKDYTIYCIDGPAHGKSGGKIMNIPLYTQCLKAFIDKYGEMDFYAGHSLGAFAILYAAFNQTITRASALFILASPGKAIDFVDLYTKALSLNSKASQLIHDYFVKLYGHGPEYFDSERFSKNLPFPGLIIHDKNDQDAPFKYAEKLHANWKESETFFTEGLGHKLRSPLVIERFVEYIESK